MIAKLFAAALALLAPTAAVPQSLDNAPTVPRILCAVSPTSYVAGSAFRIGPHLLVTAKHVINNDNCAIDGQPVKVVFSDPDRDYAILSDSRAGASLKVDCGGFKAGKEYIAIGHARGLPQLTAIKLVGTGKVDDYGFSILTGIFTVIPGQSGGVIVDSETGAAVGIVNVYMMDRGWSGSIALQDTPVCKRSQS